jgi:hypothetical protein
MAEATLPLPAKIHATLARGLDWVWPLGAAWAYGDAIAHAPGDPALPGCGPVPLRRGTPAAVERRVPGSARRGPGPRRA